MNIPYDISPLDPEKVVKYEIEEVGDVTRLNLWFQDGGVPTPTNWSVSIPIKVTEHYCPHCSHRLSSRNSRCYSCMKLPSDPVEKNAPSDLILTLIDYPKDNAKDKLVSIGGRSCLVLGTVEAAENTDFFLKNKLFLLSFYLLSEAASTKYNVLQYCLYDSETGKMYETPELKKLNDLLWTETTLHNFRVDPEWSISKIYDIFVKRSV